MKFYILDTGYLLTDKNNLVAGSAMCTRKNPTVQNVFYHMPVMCVLVEHDGGCILYDTGCNMHSMNGYWPENLQDTYPLHQTVEQNIEVQLAKCGVRVGDVDTVILSHMHFDHTGNLSLFRHADVYAPKADFASAHVTVHLCDDPTTYGGYCKKDLDVTVKQYHLIDEDIELAPGVEIIHLPGHAPGVLGLMLHGKKDGTFIFPMDAVYTSEIYGPPARATGLIANREEYFASIEKVRRLQKRYGATVVPGHDCDVFATLRKAPYFYE